MPDTVDELHNAEDTIGYLAARIRDAREAILTGGEASAYELLLEAGAHADDYCRGCEDPEQCAEEVCGCPCHARHELELLETGGDPCSDEVD